MHWAKRSDPSPSTIRPWTPIGFGADDVDMGVRPRTRLAAGAAVALLALAAVGSCGGGDDEAATSTVTTPTTAAPSTTAPSATTPTDPSTTTTPTTEPPYPTTTVHQVPAACDDELDEMLDVVDQSIAAAQLGTGGEWSEATDANPFDDRTQSAEEFRYRMGLDCMARLSQVTASGDDQMLLAAWTGDRRAWVVQATDGPAVPYRGDQRVQLFIDQPLGEWLVDQFVWAGSLATGETVIVGTVDTAFGVAAKSWWGEVPRFDDIEVTVAAEQYAIDALVQAGARNVSVGEPADFQSEIAAIQFITPLGLHLFATVAPPDWFDPAAPIVEGEMAVEQIEGVDVYVTTAVPESYAIGSVGWTCGDYVWFIDAAYGTLDELIDWTSQLISSTGC